MYWSLLILIFHYFALGSADDVRITGDAEVVVGGTLNLKATVFALLLKPEYKFIWNDDALPPHRDEFIVSSSESHWNVSYDVPGIYLIEVIVEEKNWYNAWVDSTRGAVKVNVTSLLSGKMTVMQGNLLQNQYVATNRSSLFNVSLEAPDNNFVTQQRPNIVTYWFMDCEFIGGSDGLVKEFNFTMPDEIHYIEALVVASVPKPPAPTTSTTTSTTTTTSSTTTTTETATTNATDKSPTVLLASTAMTESPALSTTEPPLDLWSEWLSGFHRNRSKLPDQNFCIDISMVPMSPNVSTYGYFRNQIITKAPVSAVKINGSNWLKEGDMLKIGITCSGSGPFRYCVQLTNSSYNVTGNEKCDPAKEREDVKCNLVFGHLFPKPMEYKLLFIISNNVSSLVTPVGVVVYQVTKQPQLSIIIVPVASSIVAVILIAFGVAYYIHTRRTYIVEVADFDFGQRSSEEMEYKTFTERLREAVLNSFFRTNDPMDSDSGAGWSPARRYGSMQ